LGETRTCEEPDDELAGSAASFPAQACGIGRLLPAMLPPVNDGTNGGTGVATGTHICAAGAGAGAGGAWNGFMKRM